MLELLLPRAATTFGIDGIAGVLHIQYVHDPVHPVVSQQYTVDGASIQASAPFPYTNEWGLNYGLLFPFFVAGWMPAMPGGAFRVAPFVLTASALPGGEDREPRHVVGVAVVTVVVHRSACVSRTGSSPRWREHRWPRLWCCWPPPWAAW